ncbi:hypothetical protein CAPTEDRAFT_85475, partial [Capitella teleta]
HMSLHTGERPNECSVCVCVGGRHSLLKQHVLHINRHKEKTPECLECKAMFQSKSNLRAHMLIH